MPNWFFVSGLSFFLYEKDHPIIGSVIQWKTPKKRKNNFGELTRVREGTLIWFLPANHRPVECPEIYSAKPSQCLFDIGRQGTFSFDRLLVRVDRRSSKTGKALTSYYYAIRPSSVIAIDPSGQK